MRGWKIISPDVEPSLQQGQVLKKTCSKKWCCLALFLLCPNEVEAMCMVAQKMSSSLHPTCRTQAVLELSIDVLPNSTQDDLRRLIVRQGPKVQCFRASAEVRLPNVVLSLQHQLSLSRQMTGTVRLCDCVFARFAGPFKFRRSFCVNERLIQIHWYLPTL